MSGGIKHPRAEAALFDHVRLTYLQPKDRG